jgi:general stress protein 26
MDSINQQQKEKTHEDLCGADAVAKIRKLVAVSPTCFFCTRTSSGPSRGARPMNVLEVDDEGNLWFLSASDSHKNQDLAVNPVVDLYFQGSEYSDFLHVRGRGVVLRNKNKIISLWKFILKTWFTGGVSDPRITLIKFTPEEGYYWDNKHGNAVAGVKMLIGAVVGRTMDDSIEGKILPRS